MASQVRTEPADSRLGRGRRLEYGVSAGDTAHGSLSRYHGEATRLSIALSTTRPINALRSTHGNDGRVISRAVTPWIAAQKAWLVSSTSSGPKRCSAMHLFTRSRRIWKAA